MLEEKSFQKSIYLKVINFFVLLGWALSWLTAFLLILLILAGHFFDFQVKIIQIPVEVQFVNIEDNPLNNGLSDLDIVSFSNPRVILIKLNILIHYILFHWS